MRLRSTLLVGVAMAVLAAPFASAEAYSNAPSHYHFTSPTGWARQNFAGVDVVYSAPSAVGGVTANMNALHAADSTAKNEAPYLLATASEALTQLQAQFSGTVVQAARTFTTAGGRLAADYVFDYSLSGTPARIRQVVFASDILDQGWVLSFTASQSAFDSYASEWDGATDSFGVDSETASFFSGLVLVMLFGGSIAAVMVVGAILIVRRSKARQAAMAPPALAPWAAPGQVQPQGPVYAPGAPPRPPYQPGAPPRPPAGPPQRPPRMGGP